MASITSNAAVARPQSANTSWLGRIKLSSLAANIALLAIVALWTFPTIGLLISSVRDKDQLAVSGWWTALTESTQQGAARVGRASEAVQENGAFVIKGNILEGISGSDIQAFGVTSDAPGVAPVGTAIAMRSSSSNIGAITLRDAAVGAIRAYLSGDAAQKGAAEAKILAAMARHAILIQRPVVIGPKGAVLARPAERALEVI